MKKVDMKQREVPVYAVSERNSLTVIKVDKVPVREISRHEATKSSYICCIRTKQSHRDKGRQGTSA